jgi:hypothetical protein
MMGLMARWIVSALGGVIAASVALGCGLVLGLSAPDYAGPSAAAPLVDSGTDVDAPIGACREAMLAGTAACAGSDVGDASCASAVAPGWVGSVACSDDCALVTSGCATPPTTFHDVRDSSFWSRIDLATIHPGGFGFCGGVFDGRYVYLVPYTGGVVFRHDSTRELGESSAWETISTESLGAKGTSFAGGAFDGRYVYLVPLDPAPGVVVRYDTGAAFGDTKSWSTFSMSVIRPDAGAFSGAVFDGRYIYFPPNNGSRELSRGIVARYDTRADFGSGASWTTFDLAVVPASGKAFSSGVFDGRYVYIVGGSGVTRYDTRGDFAAPSAWSTFDLTTLVTPKTFLGSVFDGRYLYLVPYPTGVMARYDTQAPYTDKTSWTTVDYEAQNRQDRGFFSGTFDGRGVFFAPFDATTVIRIDTMSAGSPGPGSLSEYDVAPLANPADASDAGFGGAGFRGAVFDGRHVYLVPSARSIVLRLDVKSPAWLPRGWNASFL